MKALLFIALLLIGIAVMYFYSERTVHDSGVSVPPVVPVLDGDAPVPGYRVSDTPLARQTGQADDSARSSWSSLPELDASDAPIRAALAELIGEHELAEWLVPDRIVERTVALIDSLDGAPIPLRFRPLRPVPGRPEVTQSDSGLALAPHNAARYAGLVAWLGRVEPQDLAELYLDYYPLFEQAYRAGGGREAHFNDRLVEVIEHLLTAPETSASIALVRPEVQYEFADSTLQARSFGHKVLMRVGPENSRLARVWLAQMLEKLNGGDAIPSGMDY